MRDRNLQGKLAFVGLVIFGLIWIVKEIMGLADSKNSTIFGILNLLGAIAVLLIVLVVAFVGWEVASEKEMVWKVLFAVVAVLSVVAALLGVVSGVRVLL